MLVTSVLVAVSTTDTAVDPFPLELLTYTREPSGEIAIPAGDDPTGTDATAARVAVSTTTRTFAGFVDTTYRREPSGEIASPIGAATGIVPSTVLVAVSTTDTVPAPVSETYSREPSGDTTMVG